GRRNGPRSLAMILGVHSIRGHRVLVDALLPHGAVVRLKAGALKQIFWATPPAAVPRDHSRDPRRLRHLARQLEEIDVRELVERDQRLRPEATLGAIEGHRRPWGSTTHCDPASRAAERVTGR